MNLLTIRQLEKSFSGKVVLRIRQLSLSVGSTALLTGKNGAGKTTLIRILAGLIKPDSCQHFSFTGQSAKPPAVVYLHQSPYLFTMSVRANVEYGVRRCRLPLAFVDEAMEWAGITHLSNQPARRLSGGEQRLVALARVRAMRPQLYLLDEPTAYLDAAGRRRVFELVESLSKESVTAIISTHNDDLSATVHWHLEEGDITIEQMKSTEEIF